MYKVANSQYVKFAKRARQEGTYHIIFFIEDVIKNLRAVIMSELENALAQHAPPIKIEDPSRHEMPPLVNIFTEKIF